MKKRLKTGLLMLFFLMTIFGCSKKPERQGTSKHEILTLAEVPEDKMMITLRRCDGVNTANIEQKLEEKFPDVDIVVIKSDAIEMELLNYDIQDIVLSTCDEQMSFHKEKNFIDLASRSFAQNYYLSSLQYGESDARLYFLPGPSNIYGIVYNKDMFKEHGWELPDNLDEFIFLCREIEASGIRALKPALYYADATSQLFEGFAYEQVLAGIANSQWLGKYRKGQATLSGHIEPGFEVMKRLAEENIIRDADFDTYPFDRSKSMYGEQDCAMIFETQLAPLYAQMVAGDNAPALGMMPFYSGGNNSDYLLTVPSYYIGASAKLLNKGNEKKYQKVMEILDYLSTPEGQNITCFDGFNAISSIKGEKWEPDQFTVSIENTMKKGQAVPQAFFEGNSTTEVDIVLQENLRRLVNGDVNTEQICKDMDQARDHFITYDDSLSADKIGQARADFTVLQTSQLFAGLFKEKAGAQIGICKTNDRNFGVNFKIYAGDILYGGIYTLDRYLDINYRYHRGESQNEGLVKYEMSGAEIKKLLEPVTPEGENAPAYYYTASGLNIIFMPWAGEENRISSVTLSDGSPLKDEELYTVAAWSGSIDTRFDYEIKEVFQDSASNLLKDYVIKNKEGIKPAEDKSFKLIWPE